MDPITPLSVGSSTGLDSSLLGSLDDAQQLRLSELLDEYLEQISRGETPNQQALIDANPLLSRPLKAYLEKIDELHDYLGQRATKLDISGEVLGDFQLVRPIGRGGMGIVYQAWQLSLNRSVAVKVLPSIGSSDSKLEQRFENEARAAAMLEHQNIVPIYATGKAEGVHYYAMRLIEGASLDEVIGDLRDNEDDSIAKPNLKEILVQFADLADALQNAHEVGVIHRDIKPSNILQDANKKLWITDFGLARIASFDALTRTGEMIGTMRYMSPEQAAGRGELVDHRTDIYSLAVTLYELLALHPYIEGEDGPELLSKITKNPPPKLKNLQHRSIRDVETVIQRATARHRDDRYQRAAEFRDDLRRIALGTSINTTRPSRIVRAIRWGVEHYQIVAASFFILLAMVALLVATNIASERAHANLLTGYKAVELFNQKLIKALAQAPGVEDIREDVVKQTLQFSQDFVKQDPHDLSLVMNLGAAYTNMGNLKEEQGLIGEAIENYQLADEAYKSVLEASDKTKSSRPIDESELHRIWIDNQNHFAMAIFYSNELDSDKKAAQMLASTVADAQAFYDSDQSEKESLRLALCKNNYATVLISMGETLEALSQYEGARSLLSSDPEDESLKEANLRALASVNYNLGLASKDSPEKAVQYFNDAIENQFALTIYSGNEFRVSTDIIKSYIELGTIFMDNGQHSDAMADFDTASKLAEKYHHAVPKDLGALRLYGISEINLGIACFRNSQEKDALVHLETGMAQLRKVLENNPKSDPVRIELGLASFNHAKILEKGSRSLEATNAYENAEKLLEKAAESAAVPQLKSVYESHLAFAKRSNDAGNVQSLASRLQKLAVPGTTAESQSK